MQQPFEVPFSEVLNDMDPYVDAVFSVLQSDFLTLPRGPGFVEYALFEEGYEALKKGTQSFQAMEYSIVREVVYRVPISFVVLRAMLGFTPPEWAYVTAERTGIEVSQGAARSLDKKMRLQGMNPLTTKEGLSTQRLDAMVQTACQLLTEGAPEASSNLIHRLNKADTKYGLRSLQPLAEIGVPYAMLLYERFLGRPFAGHRDAVSDLVGDVLETAIEGILSKNGISYRKTKRASRVEGFDQAPDFVIPNEFNPKIVIEAKITEDDGTARDKVTRLQHLGTLSQEGMPPGQHKYEVVACIAGRGFKVRREDMKKLILSTQGRVFTLETLESLVECTSLRDFKSK